MIGLAVLIVDSRHEPSHLDHAMHDYLRSCRISIQVVATKIDKLKSSRRPGALKQIKDGMGLDSLVAYSAVSGEGKKELWRTIHEVEL